VGQVLLLDREEGFRLDASGDDGLIRLVDYHSRFLIHNDITYSTDRNNFKKYYSKYISKKSKIFLYFYFA